MKSTLDTITSTALVIAGINAATTATLNTNIVSTVFSDSALSTAVYLIMGVSAVYRAIQMFQETSTSTATATSSTGGR